MKTQDAENQNQKRRGCCCSDDSPTAANSPDSSVSVEHSLPLQQLRVQGATCGGCVQSIERTLRSAAGVKDARMDLTTGIASVIGQVEPNDLVEALDRVGFPATVINN